MQVFKEAKNLDEHPALIEEAKTIMKKCNGLPLAIVIIGGFLAKQPKTPIAWRKMNEHISAELEMNPELGTLRAILMKSYHGLPYHLKSCFLYLSIFPEDYNISRRRLVSRWIAEGYSSEVRGKSMGEIADGYFMELIELRLINQANRVLLLRVLDLESTFGLVDHHLVSIWELLHLKYLSLRNCDGIFHLPESLGNLKQLETLDVTNTGIIKLPQAITKLRKLQYIRAGNVDNSILGAYSYEHFMERIPKLIRNKLCAWTLTLIAFCLSSCSLKLGKSAINIEVDDPINRRDMCTFFCCAVFPFFARFADPVGVTVPRGLRKMKALHTLGMVNIARGGKAILQDIKRLIRLRKLAVTGINKKNCQEFCSTLASLSSLESLSVRSEEEEGLRDCLDSLRTAPKNLQSPVIYLAVGRHSRV
ncbi:disease resistance protein Pik-2-like [Miscanthus floridulus]|uniref:disease resistance protein Pik-2-like n=1 Tax=Miscanthus floridulus TaxID=154761 RepID=UPI00345918A0